MSKHAKKTMIIFIDTPRLWLVYYPRPHTSVWNKSRYRRQRKTIYNMGRFQLMISKEK